MPIAKLFFNGGSQAVRLPKAFRFEGITEVLIERDGDRIILRAERPATETRIKNANGVVVKNPFMWR